jgi:GAF domain-containing protein
VVAAAVDNVPGTRWAGVTLLQDGTLSSPAHTGDLPSAVDELQYRLGQGPCVQSSRDQITVVANDLRTESRWPEFAAGAVELGVLAMMSFQLFVEKTSFGALNLYSDATDVFDAEAEQIGLLFAAHAGVALAESRVAANLRVALNSRDVIGQAKGIIMERYKLRPQQAFDMLVYVSQQQHRKLRDVALELTETGSL